MTTTGDHAGDVLAFGPFRLFVRERRLERDGEVVKLGGKAFAALTALTQHAGAIISHEELTARVWPDTVVEESGLRVQVAALRRALGEYGGRYITNVPGQGYCFVAPLSESRAPVVAAPRASGPAHGLPDRLERVLGRERAIAELSKQIRENRLVSVVGPGGMGKSTVAVAVAHALLDHFDHDVRFVDLGAVDDDRQVLPVLSSAVGLRSPADSVRSLTASIADRRLLLVLDCCDRVIGRMAGLAQEMVARTGAVHILATSREPLRATGEHVHRLGPLALPENPGEVTARDALEFPAVQLFVERATAAGAELKLSDDEARLIAQVCQRLDGIALAIEVAAGRVELYGLQGTAELVENRVKLLWQGRRTAVPRHRTLSAMLDWSYNLLSEVEQRVLRRLAILVGRSSLETVCAVACAESDDTDETLDALAALVEKSLVAVESTGGATVYRLLDTTRAYATRRLEEEEERSTWRRLIAFLCRRPPQGSHDPSRGSSAGHLANVRAALRWAFSDAGEGAAATSLAAAAAGLFIQSSLLAEAERWARCALAIMGESDRGTREEMHLQAALGLSGMLTRANSAEAHASLTRALQLADKFHDPWLQLRLLSALNIFELRVARFREALAVAERAQAVADRIADPAVRTMADWIKGSSLHFLGDPVAAEQLCQAARAPGSESNSLLATLGFDHRVRGMIPLARSLWLLGRADDARAVARQVVADARATGLPVSIAVAMLYSSTVFTWCGDFETAGGLVDQLLSHTERHGLGPHHGVGLALRAELVIRAGAPDVAALKDAMSVLEVERHLVLQSTFSTALAEGLCAAGRLDGALQVIDGAIASAEQNHGRFDLPEMLRVRGRVLAALPEHGRVESERCLLRAMESARQQGALAWELRAAISLATLRVQGGAPGAARELVTPLLARFAQGSDTSDLKEAGALTSAS